MLPARCKCQNSDGIPLGAATTQKNGYLVHVWQGAPGCDYAPGDVIQNGVVRGRVDVPDFNQVWR